MRGGSSSRDDPVHYLSVHGDGVGSVKWELMDGVNWPTEFRKMMVSSDHAEIMAECTLDGNVLEDSGSTEYYLHSNDGTGVAWLAEVV